MKHVPRVLAIMGAVLSLAAAVPAAESPSVAARKLDAAEAAFAAREWDKASVPYGELAAENPFQGQFWYRLGTAEYNRKRYREAIDPYERAAALGFICITKQRLGQVEPILLTVHIGQVVN